MALVEHQAGRIGPMPEWVRYIMAAKWYEISPRELLAHDDPDFLVEAATVISNAQHKASKRGSD